MPVIKGLLAAFTLAMFVFGTAEVYYRCQLPNTLSVDAWATAYHRRIAFSILFFSALFVSILLLLIMFTLSFPHR